MRKLLVATSNLHKLSEMRLLLGDLPYEVISLADLDIPMEMPEEDGTTFRDNAYKKASGIYRQVKDTYTDIWVLSDDSGLMVDALGGAPGVYSARYKGIETPAGRLMEILREMEGVPQDRRTARFITAMCLITDFAEVCTLGVVEGYITTEPRGSGGFGYDPIFYYPPLGKTYAEMSPEQKNSISHRGIASRKMKRVLRAFSTGP